MGTRAPSFNPWFRIGMDAWWLGLEASAVIGLRTMTLAAGGTAAQAEATRMVAEKIDMGMSLQMQALTGNLGPSPVAASRRALAQMRRKVRANRRRLSKP